MLDKITKEYESIAFSNIFDFVDVIDGNVLYFKKVTANCGAISELQEVVNKSGKRTIRVKLHNKIMALRYLEKLHTKQASLGMRVQQLLSLSSDEICKLTNELKTYT